MTNAKEIKKIISVLTYLEKSVDHCNPKVAKIAYDTGKLIEDVFRRKDIFSTSERAAIVGRANNAINKFENNCSCTVREK